MTHDLAGMPADEPRYFTEEGSCDEDEICVNSMPHDKQQQSWNGHPIATCVQTKDFLEDPQESERIHEGARMHGSNAGQYVGDALREIAAKKAGIVLAGDDGTKPIELDWLVVDVGAEGDGSGAGSSEVQQQQQRRTCRDCFGLRTQKAPVDANFLKIEATLLGTAVTAGVIWVTVFAG